MRRNLFIFVIFEAVILLLLRATIIGDKNNSESWFSRHAKIRNNDRIIAITVKDIT